MKQSMRVRATCNPLYDACGFSADRPTKAPNTILYTFIKKFSSAILNNFKKVALSILSALAFIYLNM